MSYLNLALVQIASPSAHPDLQARKRENYEKLAYYVDTIATMNPAVAEISKKQNSNDDSQNFTKVARQQSAHEAYILIYLLALSGFYVISFIKFRGRSEMCQ